ncbi:MAG: hypothetical protein ACLPND_16770 [Candidatus Korobacteraceae bacterium]|jgi:hypothetical protein
MQPKPGIGSADAPPILAELQLAEYIGRYLSMPDPNVILKRDGGFSSRATGKTTTGNGVLPDRTGNAQ